MHEFTDLAHVLISQAALTGIGDDKDSFFLRT